MGEFSEGYIRPQDEVVSAQKLPDFDMRDDIHSVVSNFPQDEVSTVFSNLYEEIDRRMHHPKDRATARQITLTTLSQTEFFQRIKSPQDLEKYARKVINIEAVLVDARVAASKRDGMEYKGLESMEEIPFWVISPATELTRENFDEDLDVLTNIITLSDDWLVRANIIEHMKNSAMGFVRSSEDLKRIENIVVSLKQNGYKPSDFFGGDVSNTATSGALFPAIPLLDKKIADDDKKTELLEIIQDACGNGVSDPYTFAFYLNNFAHDRLDVFIEYAKKLAEKNIPPHFVAMSMSRPESERDYFQWDLSKEGLDIFPTPDSKVYFLQHTLEWVEHNPAIFERYASFFNAALDDTSEEQTMEKLTLSANFEKYLRPAIGLGSNILDAARAFVPKATGIIAQVDAGESSMMGGMAEPDNAEDYGPFLGHDQTMRAFPLIMAKARKAVIRFIDIETVCEGIADDLESIQDLPPKVAYALAKNGFGSQVLSNLSSFIDIAPSVLLENIISSDKFDLAIQYNEQIGTPNVDLAIAADILGDFVNFSTYRTLQDIRSGGIAEQELQKLGITKTGEAGVNQLRERMAKLKTEILNPDFDPVVLYQSEFLKQYFKRYVRFDESEWGEHSDDAFEFVIDNFMQLRQEGKLTLSPEWLIPSGEVRINKVDKAAQEKFKYSEQFQSRYSNIRNSLDKALKRLGNSHALSQFAEDASSIRETILSVLRAKLEGMDNAKAIESLNQRIQSLESIDFRSLAAFQQNFTTLSGFDEFGGLLQELTFYYALRRNKDFAEKAHEVVHRDAPTFDDVSWMINFVGHIVNEQAWKHIFSNNKAMKAFKEITNIKSLEEEFARAQNQSVAGTMPLEFIPNRGLLLEFSGQIGDACWASQYESIGEEYDNLSSIIMVQNRSTKHERLAGSSLLIETTNGQGENVVIIRGLNPTENVINSLSVEDFYKKFVGYCKTLSERKESRLAIVIDNHSGGSATNRPALFKHLERVKPSLVKLDGLDPTKTTFNGYDITEDTYYIT